ncbi:MAG: hypothetical protein QOE83_2318 [Actinomycetota bacterium]|jgi:uncharacterized 2Fe-2S/4Fe-4S cluster protein (DUF4445 family)|nr:hypothetical protein [Actinomycetota bacterium]
MPLYDITYEPHGKSTRVPEGTSLFSGAHWIGLPIESSCGGRGTCGKCKVRVEGEAEVTDADHRELQQAEIDQGWRLSCKQMVSRDTLCFVPELMRKPKAATMGLHRMVVLEPNVVRVRLTLEEPTIEVPRDDMERLREALHTEGYGLDPDDVETLRMVPRIQDRTEVVAIMCGEHLIDIEPPDAPDLAYGVAIDLGTTTVVATVMDLGSGMAVGVASGLNRQAQFGGDVISRIAHSMKGADELEELRFAGVTTVQAILDEAIAAAGIDHDRVYEIVLVGNATMLHLLMGIDAKQIAVSPFSPVWREALDLRAADMGLRIHPRGRLAFLPSLGAYVGADIVAGLVATGIAREPRCRLFVDVGTNGEIALGTGERTVATAAPAGPAFEGAQLKCGMRAADGAIEQVILGGTVELKVIGDIEPVGLCGSGLIDAVAQLRLSGLLNAGGRMLSREDAEAAGHPLTDHIFKVDDALAFRLYGDIYLSQRDIRELQFAKAAVATGIRSLMEEVGVKAEDLEEVLLAGSFGSYINPESAVIIGVVPPVGVEKIVAAGNAAGEGAKMTLLSFRERQIANELPTRVEYLELSAVPGFNDNFVTATMFPELSSIPFVVERT